MQKEYAFFPGCVLSQAVKESKNSLEAIAPILGWKLMKLRGGVVVGLLKRSALILLRLW